ncbi:MAG: right-handed parallel beta-helix repeat-containing protein [Thermoanaerobaculia bacterium]|nr:right-handed parallel beta-helix repeat-containing protein [Thermoanaerobaculia bacterium]
MITFAASAAHAATYYVAPPASGGSDGNPGSFGQPWATLQHAADTVIAGDTVFVRSGSYTGFHLTTSGTVGSPITFSAYLQEIPQVVSDNGVTPDGINLEGTDYVVVQGFTVNGRGRAGIRAVLCEHVTLRDNVAQDNDRWGIFTGFCNDLLIEGNVTSGSFDEHGIYVSNSGDRPVIRGNLIFDNNANGIHMNGDISQGGDGVISDALVENNFIFGNGVAGGSGINCDGVQNSLIRNNLIFDQHASGISLYQIDGGESSTGNRILNNSIHVASDGRWALNIQDGATNTEVANNTLWSDHSFRGAIDISPDSLSGLRSAHNATEDRFTADDGSTILTLAEWQALTGDVGSFVATPGDLFMSPGSDYHLKEGSLALDTGETRADVPKDLEGTNRPVGLSFDVGAYEGLGVLFMDGFESGTTSAW